MRAMAHGGAGNLFDLEKIIAILTRLPQGVVWNALLMSVVVQPGSI